jgi:hypothetical protein
MAVFCKCAQLNSLYVENLKTDDLTALRQLRELKVLSLDTQS